MPYVQSAVIANTHQDLLDYLQEPAMQPTDIIALLEFLGDSEAANDMARFAITGQKVYGVSIPDLRMLAQEVGWGRHDFARELWEHNSRETRILAAMVDDPQQVSPKKMERWAADFDSWEVCDQCIMNLFEKTPFAWDKAVEWSGREEEFVKRAGFVLMARLAVSDKKAGDERFEPFFPLMLREAGDNRNFVRKAVSWALRQIGKRNLALHERALAAAREMSAMDAKGARWTAADVLRELESDTVKQRLLKKSKQRSNAGDTKQK